MSGEERRRHDIVWRMQQRQPTTDTKASSNGGATSAARAHDDTQGAVALEQTPNAPKCDRAAARGGEQQQPNHAHVQHPFFTALEGVSRPSRAQMWTQATSGRQVPAVGMLNMLAVTPGYVRLSQDCIIEAHAGAAAYRMILQQTHARAATTPPPAGEGMHTRPAAAHAHAPAEEPPAPDNGAREPRETAQPAPRGTFAWLSAPWQLAQRALARVRSIRATRSQDPAPEAPEGTECQPDLPMSELVQPRLSPHNNPHGHGHGGSCH